ncbi:hypothetical protein SN11_16920 [Vibrio harveyi]|nr:hypothetical protein SN11_16920 [Vibrio harveyi]
MSLETKITELEEMLRNGEVIELSALDENTPVILEQLKKRLPSLVTGAKSYSTKIHAISCNHTIGRQ